MERFKNIGLVLNLEKNNDRVIEYAVNSAAFNAATLYIICAQKNDFPSHIKQRIENICQSKITCDFKLVFLTGHPVVEITRFSAGQHIDLLLIEPDMSPGLKRFFFGSLTLSLLRKAPCAVWVVKPESEKAYRRILICVDPMAEDVVKQSLNDKLIQIGTSLAKRELSECYVVCAWHLAGESTLTSPFVRTPEAELAQLRTEEKIKAASAFEALQARNKAYLKDCQTHLIHGEPAYAISRFVDDHQIDLVVMGTLARSGIQGFVIGNTAEAIIHQLECSIMAIKPDGFVSPLVVMQQF